MKVIVCGSSRAQNREEVFAALDKLHEQTPITLLINGGARGADYLSSEWARARGVDLKTYKAAHWDKGLQAFFNLNAQMLSEQSPDLVVAFPGGNVTEHLVETARSQGIAVEAMHRKQI